MKMNLIQNEKLRIFLTLGLKLEQGQFMHNHLLERMNHTAKVYQILENRNKLQSLFIVSGRGNGIKIESNEMASYLQSKIKKNSTILQENKSMNTAENLIFSYFLLWKLYNKQQSIRDFEMHIVTSDYHIERTQILYYTFRPNFQKAFSQINLENIYFHPSPTQMQKEIINYRFIINQIQQYTNPALINWKQFAKERQFENQDLDLIEEFSSYLIK
ncbi:hypothetical protein TTHERM_00066930 (macronuclear) [Tetrahymena thermophila SB210]|uniref:DUF218 domain-containing protein n=1 Tax=Tetrahymena thermophila (strain SB210) TaxID=312017 RepID=I7MHF5_TETTS|nr:hypothetical protein TTHERM_00066930 [Tetrahymena thermophila SB210]EAR87486.2 hypothetical protein TTHERM_00066930 [Tetrahymena thermophila SB210]|eukprot:XP_001007731.2 hypothetical protein TTHERM_00066930 [Tetrahymena thermophila SB210]